jgi:hypothetical protein
MAAHDSPAKKDPSKWRLALQCAVETGVSEKIAYRVLTTDTPITGDSRERAYRWFLSKRLIVRRERTRTPRKESAGKPLLRALDEVLESEQARRREPRSGRTDAATEFRTDDLPAPERAIARANEAVAIAGVNGKEAAQLFDATYSTALAEYQAAASREFRRILERERASLSEAQTTPATTKANGATVGAGLDALGTRKASKP